MNGRISITRVQSNHHPDYIKMRILDHERRVLIDVDMSLEAFALALTGVSEVSCETSKIGGWIVASVSHPA